MPPFSRKLIVAVGSTNKVKVNAAKLAFTQAFPDCDIIVESVTAASDVPDQPMGDEETRRGAFNRALNASKAYTSKFGSELRADFAVGLEGGCTDETIEMPSLSIPGTTYPAKDLSCFAWMCVLEVSSGRWGYARTGSFSLPSEVARLVRGGMELGHADDTVFKRSNSKQEDGAVGLLSKGLITRTLYYEHALVLSLIPFIQREYYEDAASPARA